MNYLPNHNKKSASLQDNICEEIKKTIDLKSHISQRCNLTWKQEGTSQRLERCPFCSSHSGLHIKNSEDRLWNCFGCKRGGSVIDFEIYHNDMEPKDPASISHAIETIKNSYPHLVVDSNAKTNKHKPETDTKKLLQTILNKSLPLSVEDATSILKKRGFGYAASKSAEKLAQIAKINTYENNDWLIVQQRKDGKTVGIHKILYHLRSRKKLDNPKELHTKKDIGEKAGIFIESQNGTCIIVESLFNALAIYALGYSSLVLFGCENKQAIANHIGTVKKSCKQVLLWLDKGTEETASQYCQEYGLNGTVHFESDKPFNYDINDVLKESDEDFPTRTQSYIANSVLPPVLPMDRQIEKEVAGMPLVRPLSELMRKDFPPIKWIIPDILPEGACILAGAPKMGKSALALNFAIAVASGGIALGTKQVEKGSVLFLALEDGERRLQERIKEIVGRQEDYPTQTFDYACQWPKSGEGCEEAIAKWIVSKSDARLVVVDTLKKVKRLDHSRNKGIYDLDYESIQGFQELAKKYNIAIMILHHTKKGALPEDALESISGSTGLTGSADGNLILKRARGKSDAVLHVYGRDIQDLDLALEFRFPFWKLLGDAEEYTMAKEQQAIVDIFKSEKRDLSTKEVYNILLSEYPDKSYNAVNILMFKMRKNGTLRQTEGRGKYSYTPMSIPVSTTTTKE